MFKTALVFYTYHLTSLMAGMPMNRLRVFCWRRLAGFDIKKNVVIRPRANLCSGQISIDEGTSVNLDVLITAGKIAIGKNCDIAPRVIIHGGSHEFGNADRRAGECTTGEISIGDGTWIGTGATILAGARIGRGSMVAAGSVVRAGEYPENALLAGVPAVVKKIYP